MSTQTAPITGEVVHRLPGRLRVRLPPLRFDTTYTEALKLTLASIAGVTEVRVNPAASSIIISYQVQLLAEQALFDHLGVSAPVATEPPPSLKPTALAQRLGVSAQALASRCVESDFVAWSQTQDPNGIGWLYNSTKNAFQPTAYPPDSLKPPTPAQKQARRQHLKEEIGEAVGADFGETVGEVVGEGIGALLGVGGAWLGAGLGGAIGEVIGEKLGDVAAHERETDSQESPEDLSKEVEMMTAKIAGIGTGELIGEVVGETVGGLLMGPIGMVIGAEIGAVLGGEVGEAIGEDAIHSLEELSASQPPHTPQPFNKKPSRKKK